MERFKYLFNCYVSKTATALERSEFQSLLQDEAYDRPLKKLLDEYFSSYSISKTVPELPGAEELLQAVLQTDRAKPPKTIVKRLWSKPAPNRLLGIESAAAVIIITFGIWFYTTHRPDTSLSSRANAKDLKNDIAPGTNKATLTLADGSTINLSSAQTGIVVGDDLRYNDNTFVIRSNSEGSHNRIGKRSQIPRDSGRDDLSTITMTTPRGGTYQVTLSDGTKVWLNAASSLTYAAALNKPGPRRVKLEGEAYFEVARSFDKLRMTNRPFIVESRGQTVEVLGTHFNINSYTDEGNVKTTLLEGSVRVNNVTLKPNQQSLITDKNITVKQVQAQDAIAWKNGNFLFKGEHIEAIMRRLANWYDIEVVYLGQKPTEQFRGIISRHNKISEVLKMMELTGAVHFKIEGRKVYVKE